VVLPDCGNPIIPSFILTFRNGVVYCVTQAGVAE
jgi:hypothetical protein